MGYQPPLRSAVIFLLGLEAGGITARTLADLTEVPEDRAKAFMTILERCRIVKSARGGYFTGAKWGEWVKKPSRTRPKTVNSFDYVMESQRIKNNFSVRVRELMDAMGINNYELAKRTGIPRPFVYRLQKGIVPPIPHAILIARVLGKTLEELTV